METKIKNSSMTSNNPQPKRLPQASPSYSAQEKAQAVLAVWTDRCRPTEVCRQLKVPWITFNHWQHRAMEGMLQALEPRVNLTKGEALSPRLQQLLQRQQRQHSVSRLTHRLQQLQQNKIANPPPDPAKMG
jgi:transposase-like protein